MLNIKKRKKYKKKRKKEKKGKRERRKDRKMGRKERRNRRERKKEREKDRRRDRKEGKKGKKGRKGKEEKEEKEGRKREQARSPAGSQGGQQCPAQQGAERPQAWGSAPISISFFLYARAGITAVPPTPSRHHLQNADQTPRGTSVDGNNSVLAANHWGSRDPRRPAMGVTPGRSGPGKAPQADTDAHGGTEDPVAAAPMSPQHH